MTPAKVTTAQSRTLARVGWTVSTEPRPSTGRVVVLIEGQGFEHREEAGSEAAAVEAIVLRAEALLRAEGRAA